MFDLSWPELLLILIVALVLFGPGRVETAARSLGKSINAFKAGLKESLEDTQETAKK